MELINFRDAGRLLGITPNAVYSLVKNHAGELLGNLMNDTKGKKMLTKQGIEILRRFTKQIPAESAQSTAEYVRNTSDSAGISNPTAENFYKETIKSLMEQLEQSRKDSADQRQRSDTIIMKLSNDLSNAVKAIEGSRAEIRLLENRMSEAVQVKAGKDAEPEVVKSCGWMKRLGDLFFVDVAPEAPDRCANMGSYDFRYL